MKDTRKELLSLLCQSTEKWHCDLDNLNEELRHAFLNYFSETPDNLETAKYLKLGQCDKDHGPSPMQGLTLESCDVLISNVLWNAFGESAVPESVAEVYPKLTQEEWNQIIRISQIVLSLLEIPKPKPQLA